MTAPILASPSSGYGGRGYRIPGRTKPSPTTGKPIQKVYPSVTTILNQVSKEALLQWVADQTAAFAVANLNHLMMRTEEVGWGYLRFYWSRALDIESDPLRNYYNGVKDDRAELGTNIHQHIEADLGVAEYPGIYSEETSQMLEVWDEFLEAHTIVPHHSEFTVVNDEHEYAGTADADWEIGCDHAGPPCLPDSDMLLRRTLIDVKSSRHTWREHGLQIGGLSMASSLMNQVPEGTEGARRAEKTERGKKIVSFWSEEALPPFDEYALLHIRPDDLDSEGNGISRFCQLKRVQRLDLHREGFMGAIALARSEYQLKAAAKERGEEWEGI